MLEELPSLWYKFVNINYVENLCAHLLLHVPANKNQTSNKFQISFINISVLGGGPPLAPPCQKYLALAEQKLLAWQKKN